MSTSLSTKLYLKQRLNELMIYEVSDLMMYSNTFNQIIGDQVLVDMKFEDEDNAMILLCSLAPLLTALTCNKETINLDKVTALNTGFCYGNEDSNNERWLEVISWEPKAFVYHNFLTNEECEHLIDEINGGSIESSARTSTGAFFSRRHDKIVEEIEKMILDFTFIPVENGEGLQVIHYEVGQKFEPTECKELLPSLCTYGGETVFPEAKGNNRKQKLSVLPKKRDALLFWNMRPDGSVDPSSKHGGCPVIKGNKWASTKSFHVGEYKDN